MSDAPETIVLQPCFAEGWALPDRVKYETSIAIQYTRTDISQARIAGLEATMKKDAKIYYDAKAIIDAHQVIYREAREEQRARIAELETTLRRLNQWFDTDQEIIDAMSPVEFIAHNRAHGWVLEALKAKP
jgi:hypothetical protein